MPKDGVDFTAGLLLTFLVVKATKATWGNGATSTYTHPHSQATHGPPPPSTLHPSPPDGSLNTQTTHTAENVLFFFLRLCPPQPASSDRKPQFPLLLWASHSLSLHPSVFYFCFFYSDFLYAFFLLHFLSTNSSHSFSPSSSAITNEDDNVLNYFLK